MPNFSPPSSSFEQSRNATKITNACTLRCLTCAIAARYS
jgi:hypothetical protein